MTTWKAIPGYPGYEASDDGRIRSVDREIISHSRKGKPFLYLKKGRVLRPGRFNSHGHVSVCLGRSVGSIPVHTLVALTFIGPRPPGHDVCHLDGDPSNNRADNLRYDSRTENNFDIGRHGRRRFTAEEVRAMRSFVKQNGRGATARLAEKHEISISSMDKLIKGDTYSWVED